MRPKVPAVDVVVFAVVIVVSVFHLVTMSSAAPWQDDWRLCAFTGRRVTLTQFLFEPHNGHILVTYKLFAAALIEMTQWSGRAAVYASATFYVAAQTALFAFVRRHISDVPARCVVAFGIALPLAAENVAWGFQTQIHFWLLSTVLACACLDAPILSPRRTWGAAGGALLALGSFGAGIATAVAVTAVLAWRAAREPGARLHAVVATCATFFGCGLFMWRLASVPRPAQLGVMVLPWRDPSLFASAFTTSLGSGAALTTAVFLAPAVGMCAAVVVMFGARARVMPWGIRGIVATVVVACAAFATGRGSFGAAAMAFSRYFEVTQLAFVVCVWSLGALRGTAAKWTRFAATVLLGLFTLSPALSTPPTLAHQREIETHRTAAMSCLRSAQTIDEQRVCAARLHPAEPYADERRYVVLQCVERLQQRWGSWGNIDDGLQAH